MEDRLDGTQLRDVPETTLWTLNNRAAEAARPDALIHDPWAVTLRDRIDYPYQRSFGTPSQRHPLRALCFDQVMRQFLVRHPGGTVVSLGEGPRVLMRLPGIGSHRPAISLVTLAK